MSMSAISLSPAWAFSNALPAQPYSFLMPSADLAALPHFATDDAGPLLQKLSSPGSDFVGARESVKLVLQSALIGGGMAVSSARLTAAHLAQVDPRKASDIAIQILTAAIAAG